MKKQMKCPTCGHESEVDACDSCGGTGLLHSDPEVGGVGLLDLLVCRKCDGTGIKNGKAIVTLERSEGGDA